MPYMNKGRHFLLRSGTSHWDGRKCSVCYDKNGPLYDGRQMYSDPVYGEPKEPPEYFPESPVCSACARRIELHFVNWVALEELPLWVSHLWMFRKSYARYQERLTTLV